MLCKSFQGIKKKIANFGYERLIPTKHKEYAITDESHLRKPLQKY